MAVEVTVLWLADRIEHMQADMDRLAFNAGLTLRRTEESECGLSNMRENLRKLREDDLQRVVDEQFPHLTEATP